MIRVLLVDDQPLIRTGFKTILETEPGIEVVGEASDGTRGVELALELRPDVVCMDVQMPRMNGIEATRELTSRGCGSAVLILTTFDRDDFLFETLQAGASGFLLKTAEAEKLIEAVQTLGAARGCCRRRSPAGSSNASPHPSRRPTAPAAPRLEY